jgi:hypothetical protein
LRDPLLLLPDPFSFLFSTLLSRLCLILIMNTCKISVSNIYEDNARVWCPYSCCEVNLQSSYHPAKLKLCTH